MRKLAKKTGVSAVKVITAPLHGAVMVTTGITCATLEYAYNVVNAVGHSTGDAIAKAEGFLVEKIDGTPRKETKEIRISRTQMKMKSASAIAEMCANYSKAKLIEGKDIVHDAAVKIKEQVMPKKSVEEQIEDVQKEREFYINNNTDDDRIVSSTCYKFNNKIAELRKLLNKDVPTATAKEAFTIPVQG